MSDDRDDDVALERDAVTPAHSGFSELEADTVIVTPSSRVARS